MAERLILNNQAAQHIQAYLEYDAIVGNADGGKMMSEKEYENFKKQLQLKQANRLFVSWRNTKGNECKYVGPATKCFCGHRFKEHEYLDAKNKKVHCKTKGCACQCFFYIPTYGSYDFKCLCKHSYLDHHPVTRKCLSGKCAGCHAGFNSTWSCSCGLKFGDHKTHIETRQERMQSGRSVDDTLQIGTQIQGYGGIQKFGDMVGYGDGYEKQIEDMGGVSGVNNRHAPIGYKQMQAIQPQQQGAQSQIQQKKQSLLSNLNNKIKQEQIIDQYDHYQDAQDNQQDFNQVDLYQQEQGVQGGISALKLFNTPHQFSRVSIYPKITSKKY